MITRDPNDGIRTGKYLKCDVDEVVWGNEKILRSQKPRLFQRSDIINNLYEKIYKVNKEEYLAHYFLFILVINMIYLS